MIKQILMFIIVLAAMIVLTMCASVPEQTAEPEVRAFGTQIVAGYIEKLFFSETELELDFFTLDQVTFKAFSPENASITGPGGREGLYAYLMKAGYRALPIYLIVDDEGDSRQLYRVMIDLGEEPLEWEISPDIQDTC